MLVAITVITVDAHIGKLAPHWSIDPLSSTNHTLEIQEDFYVMYVVRVIAE